MEDKLLVLRCKHGNRDALCRIYEKYKDGLLVLAIALLNDKSAAEDILHDVFVGFVQGLGSFKLSGSLKAYLAICVANRARNRNRAKQQTTVDLNEAAPVGSDSDDPPQQIICSEELQRLGQAMAQLPYEQREVIILHLHSGMKLRTIANSQGISVNTAKSRYRYGLDKLRSILTDEVEK